MPDLIIDAHTVVTMDAGRRVLQDASVVVDGDRIVDIGPRTEIGKRADLVLLDTEAPHLTPWWMPVHRIVLQAVGRDVRTVVVAGEVLLEDRVVTRVDESDVLREAGLEAQLTSPGWGQVQRVFA